MELAAGNVTSASPWTRPMTLIRPTSDREGICGSPDFRMQPLCEMLGHSDCIGHRRQRRVHGADAHEEAGVDDVQIVELMSFAMDVENRGLRIGAEAAGAGLMSNARDRDFVLQVWVAWKQMVRVHDQMNQHRL